jgi:hypothetical protein
MERSHRKYNSGRHTDLSISGIPRLGAGSLLVLIFPAFKLISAAPSFAVFKGWGYVLVSHKFLQGKIHIAKG